MVEMKDNCFKINDKVKIVDKVLFEKFSIERKTLGKITRINGEHVTVEFIQNEQRTTLNLFANQIKKV